mmetsp:Transcript_5919/g.6038  ORF Transcript_5919/g.6038 Transcript_5919/m.6038 type:complete len:208 (-) Transcript_5919:467-1090(-)|eukprot:CAMPEP_0119036964 /NCGR_PEP_ID=MMETSP1177-20130426/5020_1 /TAXON_ID=2985 /ORGANISM="Ochromonas sp, Strain CCMP1899" /LENGTH=207 /DNA_ID=CAMNT_0006997553 /DNA_START=217 /DNA_END=840 /DNA_ORIENTATION=+
MITLQSLLLLLLLLSVLTFSSAWRTSIRSSKLRTLTALSSATSDAALVTLKEAIRTKNVDRSEVIKAVQALETETKFAPTTASAIAGKWEFIFTNSKTPQEAGFLLGGFLNGYFGTKEVVTFCDDNSEISHVVIGGLGRYKGASKVVSMSNSPLVLDYVYQDFKVAGIGQNGMAMLERSYIFVYVGDDLAVTRILPSGACAVLKKVT